MDFIKTKSSYVKQTKHSTTNDGGIIYERDNSTLGGINILNSHQYPIYESGNFVISVDDTVSVKRKTDNISWENNGDSDVWTLDSIPTIASADTSANEANITFNKDFCKLQDFSYFGSLSELIRTSITDIIDNFPGELYVPSEGVGLFYTVNDNNGYHEYLLGKQDRYGEDIKDNVDSEGDEITNYISNPFNLNLSISGSSSYAENVDKYLLLNDKWRDYAFINASGDTTYLGDVNDNGEYVYKLNYTSGETNCKGDMICKIEFINSIKNKLLFSLSAFLGDDKRIFYLAPRKYLGCHLRPKQEKYDNFINNCNDFEKYLLTKKESNYFNQVYYLATFEVIQENEDGTYSKSLENFMLPLDESEYNISIDSNNFEMYVASLSKLGVYYDEHFTDNLYRSMTHESIKNLDWTFTREYDDDGELEYVEGGNKMSNIIHLFGREFDEIKSYIDGINHINVLTYDNKNNLPDYFLTDCAELKGWELKNITPFSLTEYIEIDDGNKIYITDKDGANESGNTVVYEGKTYSLKRIFNQDGQFDEPIKPYKPSKYIPFGTFKTLTGEYINTCPNSRLYRKDDCTYQRMLPYYSNDEYSATQIYNEFIKRLCLNSNNIFKHKGTIEGIEEILAMFGLKSKRWVNSLSRGVQKNTSASINYDIDCENPSNINAIKNDYYQFDYEIKEYTLFTKPLKDYYNEYKENTWINWYNSTKLMKYGDYSNYRGLPVSYESYYSGNSEIITSYEYHCKSDEDKAKYTLSHNYVYPYFGNVIDGNPYYQMNGGWLFKHPYMFDKDNNILIEGEFNIEQNTKRNIITNSLFTETHSSIRSVENLTSIKDFISSDMNDGDIMFVENLNDNYVIIDGFDLYKLEEEKINGKIYWYFNYSATPFTTTIGEMEFSHKLYVSNPKYDYNDNEEVIELDELKDTRNVKVYILSNGTTPKDGDLYFTFSDGTNQLFNRHIIYFLKDKKTFVQFNEYNGIEDNPTKTIEDEKYTNYFILHNANNCNYYDFIDGWEQLKNTDTRYYRINAIIEKNKGNNPHLGHFNYDGGYEYVDYFNYLFKYVLENDLVNEDCFMDDYYNQHIEVMTNIGFQHLVYPSKDSECLKGYYEYEDTKVHSFCNLIKRNDSTNKDEYDNTIYFRNSSYTGNLTESGFTFTLSTFGGKEENDYHLSGVTRCSGTTYGEEMSSFTPNEIHELMRENDKTIIKDVDEITDNTDQIMNTKRVDIIFNIRNKKFSQKGLEEKKYIDDVIYPYLEQMLPSNIICKVDYNVLSIVTATTYEITIEEPNQSSETLEWDATSVTVTYIGKTTKHYKNGDTEVIETQIIENKEIDKNITESEKTISGTITWNGESKNWETKQYGGKQPSGNYAYALTDVYPTISDNVFAPYNAQSRVVSGKGNTYIIYRDNTTASTPTTSETVTLTVSLDVNDSSEPKKYTGILEFNEAKAPYAFSQYGAKQQSGDTYYSITEVAVPSSPVEWSTTSTTVYYKGNTMIKTYDGTEVIKETTPLSELVMFKKNESIENKTTTGLTKPWHNEQVTWSVVQKSMPKSVDIGLDDGVEWGSCNIGATKPEEYGLYFQWGATSGYSDGSHSSWSTAPFNNGKATGADSEYFATVSGTACPNGVLTLDNDAAHAYMGNGWRMPTSAEVQNLIDNTTSEWVENYNDSGINGIKFVSKKDTSKYIFIPAAGYVNKTQFNGQNEMMSLWTSSLNIDGFSAQSKALGGNETSQLVSQTSRYFALSIRGVLDSNPVKKYKLIVPSSIKVGNEVGGRLFINYTATTITESTQDIATETGTQ